MVALANATEPTLLQLAAVNGRVAVARELLDRGVANADGACRSQRQTAAHVAAGWGYCELLELLLRRWPLLSLALALALALAVCLSVCLSVCLPACLPACLSVCLSVRPSRSLPRSRSLSP